MHPMEDMELMLKSKRFQNQEIDLKLSIVVDEGKTAKIEKINIIGNEVFNNDELIDGFELSEGSFFSFLK